MTSPIETCKDVLDTIRQYNNKPETVFEYTSCLEWAAKCEEKADVYITAAYYPAVFSQEACRTAVPAGHLKLFLERISQPVPVPVAPSAAPAPATAEPTPAAPASEAPPAPASEAPAPKTGGGTGKAGKKDKRKNKDITVDLDVQQ